jgi:methionyl-tRNA formyltransferase
VRVVLVSMNDIGAYPLQVLAESPLDLVALFTVTGRGKHYMDATDHAGLTEKYNIPVHRIKSVNAPDVAEQMRALEPDYCMSLGWKQIVKDHMLAIPKIGWFGGHPVYLRLKGEPNDPAIVSAPGNEPLQYAIRGGYRQTGMSLIWVQAKIDAGEVFARGLIDLDEHETAYTLIQKMGRTTGELLQANMDALLAGTPPRMPQEMSDLQPYMPPLYADDTRIDLAAPPEETYAMIRSNVYPYPNVFIEFHGQRIYIESARMENGVFTELRTRVGGTPWDRTESSDQ